MKTKLSKRSVKLVKGIVEQFTTREFPGFVSWMQEQWNKNPPAVLADNPPNHSYDLEDGTFALVIGSDAVKKKRRHHKDLSGSIFAYKIRCDSHFRTIVRFVHTLSKNAQQEAAMAFLIEYREGSYLCNTPDYRDAAVIIGPKENLDNLFYAGVCEAILKVFREQGWIS